MGDYETAHARSHPTASFLASKLRVRGAPTPVVLLAAGSTHGNKADTAGTDNTGVGCAIGRWTKRNHLLDTCHEQVSLSQQTCHS